MYEIKTMAKIIITNGVALDGYTRRALEGMVMPKGLDTVVVRVDGRDVTVRADFPSNSHSADMPEPIQRDQHANID